MSISIEFQRRFIELSAGEDCTNQELSKRIGIDTNNLAKIINYGIIPKPHILIRIADYFDTSMEYLLGRTNNDLFIKAEDSAISVHDRIDELRNSQGLTYYELGKKTLIDRNYFSDWKTKKYLPSLDYLIALADFFKVSIDYLLGRTDGK